MPAGLARVSIELPFGWTTHLVTIAFVRYGHMSYRPDQVTAPAAVPHPPASRESITDLEHWEIVVVT